MHGRRLFVIMAREILREMCDNPVFPVRLTKSLAFLIAPTLVGSLTVAIFAVFQSVGRHQHVGGGVRSVQRRSELI